MFRLFLVSLISVMLCGCSEDNPSDGGSTPNPQIVGDFFSGFRASRILASYPNNEFPNQQYWQRAGETLASKFDGATPAGIWIVSLYQSNGETRMNFQALGANLPFVSFASFDQNEVFLTHFDNVGLKVWLQVEPGNADVDSLIHLVMNRYGHHPCVIGFGVDVEWHFPTVDPLGLAVSDEMAERWETTLKDLNPEWSLFLKHFTKSRMPANYRGDILFVNDSQDFTFAGNPFNAMISEFDDWGREFEPNPVGFQYGYPNDKVWWSQFADPHKEIGSALLQFIDNTSGLFWVDFTLDDIVPVNP
ncbi:MAG: hypothetical protein AAFP70_07830 [Calditrichota bacterium]